MPSTGGKPKFEDRHLRKRTRETTQLDIYQYWWLICIFVPIPYIRYVFIYICTPIENIYIPQIYLHIWYTICVHFSLSHKLFFSCGNLDALRPSCLAIQGVLHQGVAEMKDQGFKGVWKEGMIGGAWKQLSLSTDGVKMMIRIQRDYDP